ncbi:MAG: hypothetical protein ACK4EX_05935 [Thermaurantimonas sp.]|uniref:hypothetical protein n=1 Tax=Thermaurantimonas sp. TaxID=2681568 RepID=UPI00391A318B
MNSFFAKNASFLYLRFFLLILFGVYALYVQSNNPDFLIKTLSIFWFLLGAIALSVFIFKLVRKQPIFSYAIYALVDITIAIVLYSNLNYISKYFSDFIGILSIIMALSLLLYRTNQNRNLLLYFFVVLMLLFGILMFFDSLISEVLLSYLIAVFFLFTGLTGIFITAYGHLKGLHRKG